jgi:hypothetical protein
MCTSKSIKTVRHFEIKNKKFPPLPSSASILAHSTLSGYNQFFYESALMVVSEAEREKRAKYSEYSNVLFQSIAIELLALLEMMPRSFSRIKDADFRL